MLFLLDKNNDVFRIPLNKKTDIQVKAELEFQYNTFKKDAEFTEFSGGYKPQKGELYEIKNFSLPENILFAIDNEANIKILNLKDQIHPVALFTRLEIDGSELVLFQKMDTSHILDTSYSLIQSGQIFSAFTKEVFSLQKSIVAYYYDSNLIFFSYPQIRRFLPVLKYYEEANKEDLDNFIENEDFVFRDEQKFRDGLSDLSKKKIKMIKDSGVLELTSIKIIKAQSKKRGIKVDFDKKGKVVFPKDMKKCREIIRFLNEEYATAALTKRPILMNSKKYL